MKEKGEKIHFMIKKYFEVFLIVFFKKKKTKSLFLFDIFKFIFIIIYIKFEFHVNFLLLMEIFKDNIKIFL